MFRSIVHRVIKPIGFSVEFQKLRFCTEVPTLGRRFRREVNDVEIIGTLISDSFVLKSGTKALTIQTRDSPDKYSNHQAHLNTEANFTAGQRVYITGKLRSTPLRLSESKTLTSSTVKAAQLYVLDNESGSTSADLGDRNYVKLLGNISSEVNKKNGHSTFSIATHFNVIKPEDGSQSDGTSFHRVFAYDTKLCQYIEDKLKKRDRVLLTGRIGHMTSTGEDGKKYYSGFIIAENIYRIAARSSSADLASNESVQMNS